ncbi:tetraspanin-18-like [Melospiza georgiana]|uniref:tetraspanin-18-like n=1 Tax=Melospiza georgiana TaxID=44398 RepID=UPI0025AD4A82|nr:tetraspanin-18-like [Melospiza georgiana]
MGVLSCMKYLMFIFNVLVFAGGTCLATMGVWVAVDPAGFQGIVAARAVLSAGAWLLLAVGIALSLLGFLGCCGALRRSRPLLLLPQWSEMWHPSPGAALMSLVSGTQGTGRDGAEEGRDDVSKLLVGSRWSLTPSPAAFQFFILVSLVFLMQLIGAVLFLVHWKQRNYGGDEGAEVFSTTWNTLMVMFSCCGVLGPEDFGNGSRFQELHPGMPWPRACCARDGLLQAGELLGWEQCRDRSPGYIHEQGCFSTFGRTLQRYISLPGICSLAVLGIEIFAMFFAFCLYYNFD